MHGHSVISPCANWGIDVNSNRRNNRTGPNPLKPGFVWKPVIQECHNMHDQTSSGLTGILHSGDRQLQVPSTQWASAIVDRAYEAIIFDCDGTLVDSSAAHFKSFELAFENQNTVLEYAWYASRTGLDRIGFLTEFANTVDASLDIERAAADSISIFGK